MNWNAYTDSGLAKPTINANRLHHSNLCYYRHLIRTSIYINSWNNYEVYFCWSSIENSPNIWSTLNVFAFELNDDHSQYNWFYPLIKTLNNCKFHRIIVWELVRGLTDTKFILCLFYLIHKWTEISVVLHVAHPNKIFKFSRIFKIFSNFSNFLEFFLVRGSLCILDYTLIFLCQVGVFLKFSSESHFFRTCFYSFIVINSHQLLYQNIWSV